MSNAIYMDANATCPMHEAAIHALSEYIAVPLNPSSVHANGRLGKMMLETARTRLRKAVNASSKYEVVFTSSGTEANNLVVQGLKQFHAICSAIEHQSVLAVVGQGVIAVDKNGTVDLDELEQILKDNEMPILVSVMAANNEIGTIQPLAEVVKIARKFGAIVHSDAVQIIGKSHIDISELDLDLMTVSAHKFGGPLGAAALIFKKNLPLTPIMFGGGQEKRFRPGTQNLNAIHAFGAVCEIIEDIINDFSSTVGLRKTLEDRIKSLAPSTIIFAEEVDRLPNTSSFTMPGVKSETQLIHFDTNGFMLSAGSACSSGRVDVPYTHLALGVGHKVASESIRVSLHPNNQIADIEEFIKVWQWLYLNNNKKAV